MNRRSSAGGTVIGQFAAGATGKVLDGPRAAMGYTWWRMETTSGTGRGAQNWVQGSASTPPSDHDDNPSPPSSGKFALNDTVRVTEVLNMRSGAGTGNPIIATLPAGITGTVIGGPKMASGYTWWQIRTSRGTGWTAQDWLAASAGTATSPGSGAFTTGDAFRVTEVLNMRSGAGTGNRIIVALPAGADRDDHRKFGIF